MSCVSIIQSLGQSFYLDVLLGFFSPTVLFKDLHAWYEHAFCSRDCYLKLTSEMHMSSLLEMVPSARCKYLGV